MPTLDPSASNPSVFTVESPDTIVHLRAAGVSVLVDLRGGLLPAITHWSADLGQLTALDALALTLGNVPPQVNNVVDEPIRLALLPEQRTGWAGRPGLSGSRAGGAWSPWFRTSKLAIQAQGASSAQGASAGDSTTVTGATEQDATGPAGIHNDGAPGSTLISVDGGARISIEAVDPVAQLHLLLEIELAPSGLLRTRATLRNDGDDYQLDELSLALPLPPRARDILDFAGRWSKERAPQRRELTVGTHLREGRHGRTGADAATVLTVGTPGFGFAAGEVWGLHVGFSGNHRHYAERLSTGHQVLGGSELLLPGEVRLGAGESYTGPWLYGSYGVGLDEQARRFHRYLRARPQHPHSPRPVTLNVWEAVYFDHNLTRLTALADRAAQLGVERFVLDDGWFRHRRNDHAGLGDWYVDETVWPNGLSPLVDHVRSLGMQFGLWFEPEMVNLDSDLARAHPDWVMQTGGRIPVPSRHQQVLNLGIPDAFAYVLERMTAILAEYDIPYIKWDHNRDLVDAGTTPGGEPGVHAQTLATYRLMDELKRRFPALEIESCSSGGARVDLGVLERTDRVWVSDCIDPLERQQMNRWTAQLLPAELLGSHVASGRSHTTGRVHDLSFRAGTALFGHFGIEWDLTRATDAEFAQLGEWIALYKTQRSLLHSGDLVRMDESDPALWISGVVSHDRSHALFSLAYLALPVVLPLGRFTLRELDPDRRYRVRPLTIGWASNGGRPHGYPVPAWFGTADAPEGTVLSGRALASAGLQAPASYPEQVWLLEVAAVD
ncbi:alpha-galactosidase [Rathayibacter soli]|uniref:alpha-galactosidase n=1 Tax=Rathayibacter soli TaxID=3144168 RepID=UPI0027E50C0F|nr:alpha-galactosidase [Glaciibacter superstes]